MMQKNDVQTSRMVELLTTAAKLPDPMQALALGYAKGLALREEMSRDYNELGLYPHGETVKTATELWEMLPCWMEARRMAFIDPEYNRRMSEFIAQRAKVIWKAAQEMAEWGPAKCKPGRGGR